MRFGGAYVFVGGAEVPEQLFGHVGVPPRIFVELSPRVFDRSIDSLNGGMIGVLC